MQHTVAAIAPIFLIIILGFVLHRTRIIGEEIWSAVEHLCFYLLLPVLIVKTLSRASLGGIPVADFLLVLFVAVLGMSVLMLVTKAFLTGRAVSEATFTSLFQGATRFHGFMALAIIGPLYGEPGLALAAIALAMMVPLLNAINVVVLVKYGDSGSSPEPAQVFIKVVQNPLILACAIGLLFNFTGLPDIVFNSIEIVGDGGLGLALLSVGAGLRFGHAASNFLLVSLGVVVRLVGMPAIVLLMVWITELEGLPRTIAIISGAVPTASSSYVMARKMGGDAPMMSNILTFQILVSFVTLPLFIYLAG